MAVLNILVEKGYELNTAERTQHVATSLMNCRRGLEPQLILDDMQDSWGMTPLHIINSLRILEEEGFAKVERGKYVPTQACIDAYGIRR